MAEQQPLDVLGVGTALDRVQNLLGKGFLLAGFFPMLVFFSMNLLLGYWLFPSGRYLADKFLQMKPIEQVPYFIGLVLLIGLMGFAFWSLNPFLREVLEGRFLAASLMGSFLAAFQHGIRDRLERRLDDVRYEAVQFRRVDAREILREARMAGDKLESETGDGDLILPDSLKQAYKKLRFMRWYKRYIRYSEIQPFFNELVEQLRSKPASKLPELDKMQRNFRVLFNYAGSMVERKLAHV